MPFGATLVGEPPSKHGAVLPPDKAVLQQLNEALAKVDRAILATTEAVVSATQKLVELNAVRDKLLTLIEDLKARGTH